MILTILHIHRRNIENSVRRAATLSLSFFFFLSLSPSFHAHRLIGRGRGCGSDKAISGHGPSWRKQERCITAAQVDTC